MCLSLYQSKASRYRNGLAYLKNRVTTNEKHTIDSPKTKKKGTQANTKENYQTTKEKTKRRKEQMIKNTKNRWNKQKTNGKMVAQNPPMSKTILNVNRLTLQLKDRDCHTG